MSPFPSSAIDTTKARVPQSKSSDPSVDSTTSPYFISLRVRTCEPGAGDVILDAIHYTIDCCSTPESKARKHAQRRHTNPFGNLYGMMFSVSEQGKLPVAVKLVEFLCILDDVMEELPYEQAIREHEVLCQVLAPTSDSFQVVMDNSGQSECLDGMKKFLSQIRDTILSFPDVQQGKLLLEDLQRTLRQRECAPATFATLEEYLPYRVINLDWYFVCFLLRWSMNVDLPESEGKKSLRDFEYMMGVVAGLGNDYFSWNKEKNQYSDSDRIMNAVPVLMRQHSVSETQAKSFLHDTLVKEANNIEQVRKGLEEGDTSEGLKRYAAALEYLTGGYNYWCSTCPRYYIF